ncbi:MAG: hypothetical protein HYV07_00305 [Deltaproteobacteria bacterium]|nr:hypothetical protein [Deltaproteobacteria bacterium]
MSARDSNDQALEVAPHRPAATDEIARLTRAALFGRAGLQDIEPGPVVEPASRASHNPRMTPTALIRRSQRDHGTGSYAVLLRG